MVCTLKKSAEHLLNTENVVLLLLHEEQTLSHLLKYSAVQKFKSQLSESLSEFFFGL